ncbi:alpha/beta fold hydrolase [Geodermatophilus sp. SYSU D00965]
MTRYVLVHGAFGGAWCWEPVAVALRQRGHSVVAVDLPGSGADRTPVERVTLDAYAERVCAALTADPEPAVLVGHSMGGVVITQAASRCPQQVSRLVYVAAFLPRDGESLKGLTELPEGAGDGVQSNMTVSGEPPVAEMSPQAAREVFYGHCTDEQADWALQYLGPQPVLPFVTPVTLDPAVADVPRRYVLCTADRAIPPALQRRMVEASPCEEVLELDVDHSPWLSATEPLVDFLER